MSAKFDVTNSATEIIELHNKKNEAILVELKISTITWEGDAVWLVSIHAVDENKKEERESL